MQDFFINTPGTLPELKPGTLHDFDIRLADLGTDPNNAILMDGQKLNGVAAINVSCDATGAPRVRLDIYANPTLHVRAETENIDIRVRQPLATVVGRSNPDGTGECLTAVLMESVHARGLFPVDVIVWTRQPTDEERADVAPILKPTTVAIQYPCYVSEMADPAEFFTKSVTP